MRRCAFCHKPLIKPIWLQKKYCSRKCFEADKTRKYSRIFTCITCGKKFKVKLSEIDNKYRSPRGKYCSKKCLTKRYYIKCKVCGKKVMSRPSEKRKYCSQSCTAKDRKGKKNGKWKGGITPKARRIRTSQKYYEWQQKVFKRDNWTCQHCKKRGGKLIAHHIKSLADLIKNNPNKFRIDDDYFYQIENGLTFHPSCHYIIHNKTR